MRIDLRRLRLDRGETIKTVSAATRLPTLAPARGPSPRLAGLSALLAYYGLAIIAVPAAVPGDADR